MSCLRRVLTSVVQVRLLIMWAVARAAVNTLQKYVFTIDNFDFPIPIFMAQCIITLLTVQLLRWKRYVVFRERSGQEMRNALLIAASYLVIVLYQASLTARFIEGICSALSGFGPVACLWLSIYYTKDFHFSRKKKCLVYLSAVSIFMARFTLVLNVDFVDTAVTVYFGIVNVVCTGLFLTTARRTLRYNSFPVFQLIHDIALTCLVALVIFNIFDDETAKAYDVLNNFGSHHFPQLVALVIVSAVDLIYLTRSCAKHSPVTITLLSNALIAIQTVQLYLNDMSFFGDILPDIWNFSAACVSLLVFFCYVKSSV